MPSTRVLFRPNEHCQRQGCVGKASQSGLKPSVHARGALSGQSDVPVTREALDCRKPLSHPGTELPWNGLGDQVGDDSTGGRRPRHDGDERQGHQRHGRARTRKSALA